MTRRVCALQIRGWYQFDSRVGGHLPLGFLYIGANGKLRNLDNPHGQRPVARPRNLNQ